MYGFAARAQGDLFIAIAGKKHDAHEYLRQVIEARAAAALVHKEPEAELVAPAQKMGAWRIMLVDDTIAGLNRLAAAYRAELRAKVIAVGGSNGKTTTKRIIHTVLGEKFNGHASPKSFNNNIGMPLTLLEVERTHDFVVLEIGTNAPGEIAALGEVCPPGYRRHHQLGLEHLEQLVDLERRGPRRGVRSDRLHPRKGARWWPRRTSPELTGEPEFQASGHATDHRGAGGIGGGPCGNGHARDDPRRDLYSQRPGRLSPTAAGPAQRAQRAAGDRRRPPAWGFPTSKSRTEFGKCSPRR